VPASVAPAPAPAAPAPSTPSRPRGLYAAAAAAILAICGFVLWRSVGRGSTAPAAGSAVPIAAAAPIASSAPLPPAAAPPPAVPAPTSPASAAASSAPAASLNGLASRTMLRRAAAAWDWVRATDAFFALVDHDPTPFHESTLVTTARDVATNAGIAGDAAADRGFDALAQRSGNDGIDVLYELVRTRGGTKAAARAQDLLTQSAVIARASPELRLTFTLRDAPCADKPALLDRAAAEGDTRTLLVMQTVAAACLGKNHALADAPKALRLRLSAH
jgi:eukaryotic-like serine/threonine-protein kinase